MRSPLRAVAAIGTLAVLGLVVDIAAAPPAHAGPLPALHVAGNQLVDPSGNAVTLHGADMSGTEFTCAQNWTTYPFGGQPEDSPATFAAMRSWGINAVRIPLNEDCWLGINGVEVGGAAYQTPVVKLVRDLEAAGFYVIVDLHWSAPGAQRALSQNPAPDEDHSPAFWASVASTFASDSGVLFDLYNEPYFYWLTPGENEWQVLWQGGTLTQYVTGGSPYTVTANWQTAGFDQLTSLIRAAGATQPIMAGCVDWANDCSQWGSSFAAYGSGDANTVVSWHSYPGEACDTAACWDANIAPLAASRPVVVGETGDSTAGPETYLPTFLPWAQSHGLSVLAWTWNAWGNASDVLVTSMTAGTPTTGEGATYKAWLASLGVATTGAPSSSTTVSGIRSSLSTSGGLPLTRVVGINLGGGAATSETPLSAQPAEIADAAQNLHVTWLRYGFQWWVEDPNLYTGCTASSCYDWTVPDTIMQAAVQNGIGVIGILGGSHWPNGTLAIPTVSQWTSFVSAVVDRYDAVWKPEGLRGFVVEPWNEPDQGTNWNLTPAQFAQDIELPAYQAVKAVDPSVLLTMETTDWSTGGQAFWNGVASAMGSTPFVDLPGFHDYANSAQTWAPEFRSWLAAHGIQYTAVWTDEFGAAMTPPVPYDDTTHIQVLEAQIPPTLAGSGGPDMMAYYCYKDLVENGTVKASYGLMDQYGNHYQSYSVFQQLMAPTAPSPSPTPTPTTSPTATPTPTPTASPTATPTPTPTPTAIPTPTPTPTPSVSFTETLTVDGQTCTITVAAGVVSGTCT